MKTISCAFTGHRPQSLPFGFNETDSRCIALKRALHDQIINLIRISCHAQFSSFSNMVSSYIDQRSIHIQTPSRVMYWFHVPRSIHINYILSSQCIIKIPLKNTQCRNLGSQGMVVNPLMQEPGQLGYVAIRLLYLWELSKVHQLVSQGMVVNP